ncbi:MAG: class I SAM-dependent methyltransferase [Polyangiaceae bacterium]|nr:class I SAM-dependent methyltransferase [Polyangiaceae bacterium]
MTFDFSRYLLSKQTVDDRAIDRNVLERFAHELRAPRGSDAGVPKVLELGAGLGTMVTRLCDWGVLTEAEYTLLDENEAGFAAARERMRAWAANRGLTTVADGPRGAQRFEGGGTRLTVDYRASELDAYLDANQGERFDVISAHAFLDLVDVPRVLPQLWRLARPGALFWFSTNFDGETTFLPEDEHDEAVLSLYHRSMGEHRRGGRPVGDSRAGRRLFGHLAASGAETLAAGSSDAVVFAQGGRYPADEAYFVAHILEIVRAELASRPELAPGSLEAWVARRRRQLEAGELVYLAHQLDFAGRVPASAGNP